MTFLCRLFIATVHFKHLHFNPIFYFFLVSNKWIHERGQEFLRPCGLTEVDWTLTPPYSFLYCANTLKNTRAHTCDIKYWTISHTPYIILIFLSANAFSWGNVNIKGLDSFCSLLKNHMNDHTQKRKSVEWKMTDLRNANVKKKTT